MSNELKDFEDRIKAIARSACPEGVCLGWDVYPYPGKPFVMKVEDPTTKRWAIFDYREALTDDDIKERMKTINQKPEGEES